MDYAENTKYLEEKLRHVSSELELYKKKLEQASQSYNCLLSAFKASQRRTFGPRSERFSDNSPGQGDFFSTVAPKPPLPDEEGSNSAAASSPSKEKKGKKRRKKNKNFAKNLPRREVVIRHDQINSVSNIITAPNPARFLPQAKVTENFLAHSIVSKLYDRQPYHYYVYIMQQIPSCETIEDYEWLLPWNVKFSNVKIKSQKAASGINLTTVRII